MKKRLFSLFMSLIMVISLVSVLPTMSVSAKTSGDYEYKILSNDTVEITKYNGSAKTITIPSKIAGKKVTSIGDWAFGENTVNEINLKNITIPNTVISIKNYAFCCHSITNITIPNSVKNIGEMAFAFTSIKKISIPNSVTNIGDDAFYSCQSLKSITIGKGVKSIGRGLFYNCDSLTSITIPNNVKSIGNSAFMFCANLQSVTIGKGVTNIEPCAFIACKKLKNITIPKSVKKIGKEAFGYYCSMTGKNGKYTDFKIKCYSGTAGEKYAKNNGFKYQLILPTVSDFKMSLVTNNSVKLKWNKVSGATGYYVYQQKNGKWSKIKTTKSTSYTVPKLKSGTTYKFAIKAYKTSNSSTITSASYSTVTTSTKPATVNFKLTAGSKKSTVKWNKVTGATGYKVYYKTSKNGSWKCLKTTNNKTTSYTKTGLTKGKTYYFTVKAYRTVCGKTYNGSYATKSIKVK